MGTRSIVEAAVSCGYTVVGDQGNCIVATSPTGQQVQLMLDVNNIQPGVTTVLVIDEATNAVVDRIMRPKSILRG